MTPVMSPVLERSHQEQTSPYGTLQALQLARGKTRAVGDQFIPLAPLKTPAPILKRKQACHDAMREACFVAVQQVLHNWAVVLGSDDPEGPHQMRVGLRQLRSTIKAFRSEIDQDWLRHLDERARTLGRVLSELRDADVLVADIVDPVLARRDPDPGLPSLKAVLEERVRDLRQSVRGELTSDKWSDFWLQLFALPEEVARVGQKSVGRGAKWNLSKLSNTALKKRWRRVAKAARRLEQLTIAERHELRKDLKKLRYTAELFSSLYPSKNVRQFSTQIRRLQDGFGYLNDVAVAEKLKLIAGGGAAGTPDVQRAVGYVIGWHAAHADEAWRDIAKDWRKLSRVPRFWSA